MLFRSDQYVENSTALCDSLINGCAYEYGSGFENDYIVNEYGKGLGKTYAYYYSGQGQDVLWRNKLFYYKKGGFECGVSDTLTAGIDKINSQEFKFTIYPNPATSAINIKNETQFDFFHCIIANSLGQIILSEQLNGTQNKLNINHLKNGIYFLQINSGNHITIKKFIKE